MSNEPVSAYNSSRLRMLIFCLTFGFTVVVGRLIYYQVLEYKELHAAALTQRTWDKTIEPTRGYITDIHGQILALNSIEWDISVSPSLVVGKATVADRLSELLEVPTSEISATLVSKAPWAQLATGVDYETGEAIAGLKNPGITCTPRPRRFYPEGDLFSHVLGFVNDIGDGYYGVEGYYDQTLRGKRGLRTVEQDPVGEELPFEPLDEEPALNGVSLVLTLDRNVQYIAAEELERALEEYGAQSGTVLIMNPKTGAILATVSVPSYEPNDFLSQDDSLLPDPAVSGVWEPGSIFKIVTWGAGLDSGTISPGTTFYDEGALEVGGRVIRNWDRQGNGLVTMSDGLIKSLNTVAAFISTSMGKDRFYTYLRRFGFGSLSGVDLASEVPGMMKLPGDSNWYPSDLGTNAFGQGIAVTPVQMLAAASAVANQGTLMKPYIVQQIISQDPASGDDRVTPVEPMVVRRTISRETAETLTQMLVRVVEEGATQAEVPGYRVAGKTGTAQVPTPYGYHPTYTIGSFIGFAPADDPQFIVLVKLDRPSASPWGSQTAAPTFRAIAARLFSYLQIPPDDVRQAQGP